MPPPGIFPTQGSNPGLLHHRQILYRLSHQGRPLSIWEGFVFNHYLRYVLLMRISTIDSMCEVLVVLHVFQLMDILGKKKDKLCYLLKVTLLE